MSVGNGPGGKANISEQDGDAAELVDAGENWTSDLEEALVALEELGAEDPEQALAMFDELPEQVQGLFDFQLALALLYRNSRKLEVARDIALRLLEHANDDPDVHHLLGDVYEDLGQEKDATRHFVQTLRLDRAEFPDDSRELINRVGAAAQQTLMQLPDEFKARLSDVPLLVESHPSENAVEEGLDPRCLGTFEGPAHEQHRDPAAGFAQVSSPTRIVLYAHNLAAQFDDEELEEQVRITVLHEVGHYFGLDEADMERLGWS